MSNETAVMKAKQNKMRVKQFIKKQAIFLVLVGLTLIMSIISPVFRSPAMLLTIAVSACLIGIIAAGQTFVIITGGIDLSVGSIVGLVAVVTAGAMVDLSLPPIVAVFLGVCLGALIGLINGFFISKVKMPPFIVTMGMMQIARGLALVYTKGQTLYGMPKSFISIATNTFLGIPVLVWFLIIVYIASWYLLQHTKLGRYALSIGGNETATKLSGINVDRYKTYVYIICGVLAALSGVLLTARIHSATATNGEGYELEAIAGVVIGGTSLLGGVGRVTGTLVGILIVQVVKAGLTVFNVSPYWHKVVTGCIILLAVFLDIIQSRKEQNHV